MRCKDRELKFEIRNGKWEMGSNCPRPLKGRDGGTRITNAKSQINKYQIIKSSNLQIFKSKIIIVVLFSMSIWKVLLAILFPPLAVIGKGCGSVVIVFILTVCGWVPGVIAALIILNNPKSLINDEMSNNEL